MDIRIDLNEAIFALSDSLDLVGIDEVAHGKRVGYMAFKCAEAMQLEKSKRDRLFHMGLLHDCGVSSSQVHEHLVTELRWAHDEDHAITGQRLLNQSRYLKDYATAVRYHHTPWEVLIADPDLAYADIYDANLIFLVDRVDAMASPHLNRDLQNHIEAIRNKIRGYQDSLFSPEAVEYFLQASNSDSFWLMLEYPHLERFMVDIRGLCDVVMIANEDVKDIARIFSQIVDAKSAFTFEHSLGVATLSRYIAQQLKFDKTTLDKIEIAGLLHDLGKLRIPDEILDNPGALKPTDIQTMHRHSFETYQVLRQIGGFSEIALWASYHHEKPNGTGYPFKRTGHDLSSEARIIAVADIFQALAQARPYRAAMPLDEIVLTLKQMAGDHLLDREIVQFVIDNQDACLQHAVNLDKSAVPLSSLELSFSPAI